MLIGIIQEKETTGRAQFSRSSAGGRELQDVEETREECHRRTDRGLGINGGGVVFTHWESSTL